MQIRKYLLPGVVVLDCPHHMDCRGSLTKLYHSDNYASLNLSFSPQETFLTKSHKGVLRGMHFQTGKASHDKVVSCQNGHILDVVVDVRPDSPYFNQPVSVELKGSDSLALFIGKGYAHGFLSLQDDSFMLYHTSTVHQPEFDSGVHWSSIDFEWPTDNPIISYRDMNHRGIGEL